MSDEEDEGKPIGAILDALGVTADLEETQRITEVLVVAKVIDLEDGEVDLGIYSSVGGDWMAQLGLFRAATLAMETTHCSHTKHDEED